MQLSNLKLNVVAVTLSLLSLSAFATEDICGAMRKEIELSRLESLSPPARCAKIKQLYAGGANACYKEEFTRECKPPSSANSGGGAAAPSSSKSLQALFDGQSGGGKSTPGSEPAAHPRHKATGLAGLMQQQEADEAESRRQAEVRKQQEEMRLAQLRREQEEDEERRSQERREEKERQDTADGGVFGMALGAATHSKNLTAAGATQYLTGEKQDLTGAYKNDIDEERKKQEAEDRRREAEAQRIEAQHRRQEAAASKKIDEDNRRIADYNRQQAQQRQQAEAQRHQQEQQRQQIALQQDEARKQQEKQQKRQNAVADRCVMPGQRDGHTYLFNHCSITVHVRIEDANGAHSATLSPGAAYNPAARVEGSWEARACAEPYEPGPNGCF